MGKALDVKVAPTSRLARVYYPTCTNSDLAVRELFCSAVSESLETVNVTSKALTGFAIPSLSTMVPEYHE